MNEVTPAALYGHVRLLILKILSKGRPMHGLEIIDEVKGCSGAHLQIEEAALYPALHRLQRSGLLNGEWRISNKKRRAKFYQITDAGFRELATAMAEWKANTSAIGRVLEIVWEDLP